MALGIHVRKYKHIYIYIYIWREKEREASQISPSESSDTNKRITIIQIRSSCEFVNKWYYLCLSTIVGGSNKASLTKLTVPCMASPFSCMASWDGSLYIYIYIYIYILMYNRPYLYTYSIHMKHARRPQTIDFGHWWLWSNDCAASNGNLNILSRTARIFAVVVWFWGLGTWRPSILEHRLLAAGLRHILGTWA